MKHNWVPMRHFCDLYGLDFKTIEVAKSVRLPKEMFNKTTKGEVLIDIKFVNKRLDARKRYWNMSHTMYYELYDIVGSQWNIARIISKLEGDTSQSRVNNWSTWMNDTQFRSLGDMFILNPRSKDYTFIRYARWALAIERRYGTGTLLKVCEKIKKENNGSEV